MFYGCIHQRDLDKQLATFPKAIAAALAYVKENDMAAHEAGVFDISPEGIAMRLQVMDMETKPRGEARPEVHRKFVDVQFLAAGANEAAYVYADDGKNDVDEDQLDTPRDICFYKNRKDAPESMLLLTPGTFAVYFPWDVHVPGVCAGDSPERIRKIVIKVPVSAL